MHFVLKSYSPYSASSAKIRLRATRWYLSQEFNKTVRLTSLIEGDEAKDLLDETDHDNPCQLASPIELFLLDDPNDATGYTNRLFVGSIFNKEITRADGKVTIKIEATDSFIGGMAHTNVSTASAPYKITKSIAPEYFQATNLSMVPLKSGVATYQDWFYPALAETQAWCPVSGAYATVYTTSKSGIIGAADTTITTNTTNHRRMKQRGIIKIVDAVGDDEYVYYDGYGLNAAGDGYEFRNCIRGCLGVAASAHTDAELELRQFVPARMYIKNSDWSLDYATAPKNTRITPHPEDGYFEFDVTPTSVVATYKYINENNAAGHDGGDQWIKLEYAIDDMIGWAGKTGPVILTHTIEVPDIVVPGVEFDGADILTMVLKLIDERGLSGHIYDASYPNYHPRIAVWVDWDYDGSAPSVFVSTVVQNNSSAVCWPGFVSVKHKHTMENTYTCVGIVFTDTSTGARTSRICYLVNSHDNTEMDAVYDADAFGKFYGGGGVKMGIIERDEMSEGEATGTAESILRQGTVLPDMRIYEVDQFPSVTTLKTIMLSNTIYMPDGDGYYGVLSRYDLRCEGGTVRGTLYLTDTLGGVT